MGHRIMAPKAMKGPKKKTPKLAPKPFRGGDGVIYDDRTDGTTIYLPSSDKDQEFKPTGKQADEIREPFKEKDDTDHKKDDTDVMK